MMQDIPHFPELNPEVMDPGFVDKLVALREVFNRKMVVTSSFRTAAENVSAGGTRLSAHLEGRAVDIRIRGTDAYDLVRLAMHMGFTGIGIKQTGHGRFIHLDDAVSKSVRIRPMLWSYR